MMSAKESWDNLLTELRQVGEHSSQDPRRFMESRGLVDWIPKLVLYDDSLKPEINMVHYTTWKHALDMFNPSPESSPILRMYNYEQSNDPDEGKIKPPE